MHPGGHDKRIIKVEKREVYFKYKKTGSKRWRTMKIGVMEFIRRFLQHVLPTGFMKVRYYGFMHPSCAISLDDLRVIMEKTYGLEAVLADDDAETRQYPILIYRNPQPGLLEQWIEIDLAGRHNPKGCVEFHS